MLWLAWCKILVSEMRTNLLGAALKIVDKSLVSADNCWRMTCLFTNLVEMRKKQVLLLDFIVG